MRIAFTGHRQLFCMEEDDHAEKAMKLQFLIVKEIWDKIHNHADTFLCGSAMGADIVCGEIVLDIKQSSRPDIKLICAVPFREYATRLSADWKERCIDLLTGADRVVQVCDGYQPGCFHRRNRYLVDNCDSLIAVYNESGKGGTAYTVDYAKQKGKEIIIINPDTLTRTVIPAE